MGRIFESWRKLEGKIASDWVSLLERKCLRVLQGKRKVVLDLSDVTFVDRGDVEMLGRMAAEGIYVINCSAPIEDLLRRGNQ